VKFNRPTILFTRFIRKKNITPCVFVSKKIKKKKLFNNKSKYKKKKKERKNEPMYDERFWPK